MRCLFVAMLVMPLTASAQGAQPSTPAPPAAPVPAPAPAPAPAPEPPPAPSPAPPPPADASPPSPAAEPAPAPPEPAPTKTDDKPTIVISGYLQGLYTRGFDTNDDGSTNNDALSLKRVRLKAVGHVWDKIGYTIMFDPSTPKNILRDGFISFEYVPNAEIRVGQQKTQFGYENPESSTKLWTINRALASDALGRGSDLRDIGIGIIGNIAAARALQVEYAVTLVNGAGPNVTQDDTDSPSFWGRVGPTWVDKQHHVTARLGGSFATGTALAAMADPATGSVSYTFRRYGADLELDAPWLFFAAEYLMGSDEPRGGATVDKRGFYVLAVAKTAWHAGPVLRYEQYDPDSDADSDLGQRVTVGAYWDVAKPVRVLADYEIDRSDKRKDDQFLLFGQVKF